MQLCSGVSRGFLSLLLSLSAVFGLFACEDSSDGGGGNLTQTDFPEIRVDPELIVFSGISLNETTTRAFTISNVGGAQLAILEMTPSNGLDLREFSFSEFEYPLVLEAGESQEVMVTYTPLNPGEDSGSLVLQSNDPDRPETVVRIQALEAQAELRYAPDRLLFGSVASGSSAVEALQVINLGAVPVDIVDVYLTEETSPDFTLTGDFEARPTLDRENQISYEVLYTPTGLNQDSGDLVIETTDELLPIITIPLRGEEPSPRILVSPESVAFGAVDLGAVTEPATVLVENVGDVPLEIERIYPQPNPPEINGQFQFDLPEGALTIEPGDAVRMTVAYAPQQPGTHLSGIVIQSNDPRAPFASVPVSGRVRRPCISVEPGSIDYGRVALGVEAGPVPVRVVNCGDLPLELSSVAIDGDPNFRFEAADGANVNDPIEPRGLLVLNMFYNNVGLQENQVSVGNMLIENNDPEQPQVDVPLRVVGGGAPTCNLVIVPSPADFGLVSRGGFSIREVEVVNSGTGNCEIRDQTVAPLIPIMFGPPSFAITRPLQGPQVGPGSFNPVEITYTPQVFNSDVYTLNVTYFDPYLMEERVAMGRLVGVSGESDIEVIPERLDFGAVTAGQCASREERVTVYNTGIINICITDIYLDGPGCNEFFVVDRPVANEEGCIEVNRNIPAEVRLQYEPANLGGDECALVFESDASDTQELRVPLTGEGVPDAETSDVFEQVSGREVDVLLVVDNSGSMSEEQQNLRNGIADFLRGADQFRNNFQIGVITTDMTNENQSGKLQGNPRIVTRDADTARLVGNNADVGTGGDGDEQGLEAAQKALSNPLSFDTGIACNNDMDCVAPDMCVGGFCGGHNRGFLRERARLEVVFLSDEDDSSPGTLNFYIDFLKNIKGFRNESLLGTSMIVGADNGRPSDCEGAGGNASAGRRWGEVADRTNGAMYSICDNSFGTSLREIGNRAFGLQRQFFLSRPAVADSLEVTVDGRPVPGAWAYDEESNSVIFNEGQIPTAGSRIQVDYEAECFQRRQ
ncbi:MAG: choice-of-anchor D domain-containing protein [Bradymonadia bacterium]